MKTHRIRALGLLLVGAAVAIASCADSERDALEGAPDGGPSSLGAGDAGSPEGGELGLAAPDPSTCEEAAATRSYVGCDYWPVPLANSVQDVFDFAVVVSNVGTESANVAVSDKNGIVRTARIEPGRLQKIFLPWNYDLREWRHSALSRRGAYHLVSDHPVVVYQFNPLQYRAEGGPAGKSWKDCDGGVSNMCFSYTNDASLLLPSTALTGNYRITGLEGFAVYPAYFTVVATQDQTLLTVTPNHRILPTPVGPPDGVPEMPAGRPSTLSLDAGDVVQFVSDTRADHSGTILHADKPIEVFAGIPCTYLPHDYPACDHVEETVMPAETWGKAYVVPTPTGKTGNPVSHNVRLYGGFDGTELTYENEPRGAPDTLSAGQVVDLGVVQSDFIVRGSQPFAVGVFLLGENLVGAGDPSQSMAVPIEQYRQRYVFLAPDDYDHSFADVVASPTAALYLDGHPVSVAPRLLGGFRVYRVPLENDGPSQGAHVLESSEQVGLQVIGYGRYTSYAFPGGLALRTIAPPPPPLK